jgi:diguanylate cyclase (GGDEF)-like protein
MVLTLLLPWFPILLGAGIGARLLGRTRGPALGILCALFWIVLVQTSAGVEMWSDPWSVVSIVSGATAIVAMGYWAGEAPGRHPAAKVPTHDTINVVPDSVRTGQDTALQQLCSAIDQFDDWLECHRDDTDPWPKFDEFIRSVMYQCCKATHVKPYRLLNQAEELVPLWEQDPPVEGERLSARRGIIGHVVTTGRSYLAGCAAQGELVERLANESPEPLAWCFAVRQDVRRLGVVLVSRLDIPPQLNMALLRAVEKVVNLFWCALSEAVCSRSAIENDPVSGLRTRPVFLPAAERTLRESYRHGEPVAVAVIALEGLRELNDTGRWEIADEMVREVAGWLRKKTRTDDCLGRFDGSRFILLLRRVDSELASLIVTQIMSRAAAICDDRERWQNAVTVRCGVVGSGTDQPDLRTLMSRALTQCRRARLEDVPIASDLKSVPVTSGALA